MATLTTLKAKILLPFGSTASTFLPDSERETALIAAIQEVEGSVPDRALKSMNYVDISTPTSTVSSVAMPADFLRLRGINVIESNAAYGRYFDIKDEDYLRETKRHEGNLALDDTLTRIAAPGINSGLPSSTVLINYSLYPSIPLNRTIGIDYIRKATITGTMSLPSNDPDLQEMAVWKAIEICTAKKARWLDIMQEYGNLYAKGLERVRADYGNA